MDIQQAKTATRAQWFTIGTRVGEFEALVEPFGNREWRRLYNRLTKPFRKYMRKHDGALPEDKDIEINVQCLAETVLKDWRGITNNGEAVPFSVEAATDLLANVDEARNGVSKAALELADVYASEREDSEGNSEAA